MLVFIDERLGIDPAVVFGRMSEPFHQSLRSTADLTTLQYRFDAVHFIGRYRHFLQLLFVEGAVQRVAEIVPQAVHGRFGGMNFVYGEHLFAPVRFVPLFERAFVLADAYAIRHVQLGHALTVVSVQTLPHLFLILCIDLRRSHTDAAVTGVVVRSHQVRKDVDVTLRLNFREVVPHASLQRFVESFHDARLRLHVVRGEVMDATFP